MDEMPNAPQQMPGGGPGGDQQPSEQSQIASLISDIDRRLRVLEERYSTLRQKLNLTDQNMVESEKSFGRELRDFNDQIMSLKRIINDFNDKVIMFGSEMGNAAKKSDLKVIEKYLAMWDPKIFVTRSELKEYLKSKGILQAEQDASTNPDES